MKNLFLFSRKRTAQYIERNVQELHERLRNNINGVLIAAVVFFGGSFG